MDEKLKDEICKTACPIGYPRCSQGTSCLIPVRLEQAFRDAKWIETQQPAVQPCPFERIGELAEYCDTCCGGEFESSKCPNQGIEFDTCLEHNKKVAQAQYAHMIARGYRKLPSEQECIDICRYLMQHSRNIRQGGQNLLKLLKESTWNTMK